MFADDTFSLKSDKNLPTLINDVNIEINKMAIWFRANKLAVNKSKTKFIIFRTRGKKIDDDLLPLLFDENERGSPFNQNLVTILERYHNEHQNANCRSYKLLGIHLDEYLNLDYHIKHLQNKLSRSLYCIKAAKNNLNFEGLKALYFALIHSHLTYCPIITSMTSKSNLAKLGKIQKKAIGIITKSAYNAHTPQLFLANQILPIDLIIKQAKLKFMHAVNFEYAPKSFSQTWIKNIQRQDHHHLRNNDLYFLPIPRLEIYKKTPIYSLAIEWNKAGVLTLYENKTTFSLALKNQLFSEIVVV